MNEEGKMPEPLSYIGMIKDEKFPRLDFNGYVDSLKKVFHLHKQSLIDMSVLLVLGILLIGLIRGIWYFYAGSDTATWKLW